MKYWYVSYVWRYEKSRHWEYQTTVAQGESFVDMVLKFSDYPELYVLLAWEEINKQEYEKLEDIIG